MEDLGAPAYKIASFEIVDIPLIKYTIPENPDNFNRYGNELEIEEAIEAARDAGCKELALCIVYSYPAPIEDCNLNQIVTLRERFGVPVGSLTIVRATLPQL